MSNRDRLDDEEIAGRIHSMDGWSVRSGKLHRELTFASFSDALAFMNAVGARADEMDHHPDWCNSYNRVVIDLVSHDVGGISERDFRLATIIDRLAETLTR